MLKGGGLAGIAIVLTLLFAAWVSFSLGQNDLEMRGRGPSGDPAACAEGDHSNCDTNPTIFDKSSGEYVPANPYDETYRNEYRAERDIRAQRAMAFWAAMMFFATVAGVVLIYFTLVESTKTARFASETLEQAKIDTGIARRQLALESRPWLIIRNVRAASDLTWDENGNGRLFISFQIQNKGKGPATLIKLDARIAVEQGASVTQIQNGQTRHLASAVATIMQDAFFPEDSQPVELGLPVNRSDLDLWKQQWRQQFDSETRLFTLILVGVIQYSGLADSDDSTPHNTPFAYSVARRGVQAPDGGLAFIDDLRAVPQQYIHIRPHHLGHGKVT